jgi:AcrR family transcriptional regulator
MGRRKEFDEELALDAAIGTFREHGYEGSSASMLTHSMKIGRQSLYDTFGDKWQLYLSALRRYALQETGAHIATLRAESKAIDGIRAAVERVVSEAHTGCLGVNSVCEFGDSKPDLGAIRLSADSALRSAFVRRIREAQDAGDVASELDPDAVMDFLSASFAGIRVAARGGPQDAQLAALGQMALRALA